MTGAVDIVEMLLGRRGDATMFRQPRSLGEPAHAAFVEPPRARRG